MWNAGRRFQMPLLLKPLEQLSKSVKEKHAAKFLSAEVGVSAVTERTWCENKNANKHSS